jgi:hypothetical protein
MSDNGVPRTEQTSSLLEHITKNIPNDLRKQLITLEVLYKSGTTMVSQPDHSDENETCGGVLHESLSNSIREYICYVSKSMYEESSILLRKIISSGVEYTDLTTILLKQMTDAYRNQLYGISYQSIELFIRVIGDTQLWFTRGVSSELQLDAMTMLLCNINNQSHVG